MSALWRPPADVEEALASGEKAAKRRSPRKRTYRPKDRQIERPRPVLRVDDNDFGGVLDRLREGLRAIDREAEEREAAKLLEIDGVEYVLEGTSPAASPRSKWRMTVTHPRTLIEIQARLDAELDELFGKGSVSDEGLEPF